MMLHHHIKFGPKITLWTFAVTLTLNAVIKFFHRTLLLMMLYYQTMSGCKRTRSLEDIVKIVMFLLYKPSLWPWHWRVKHGPPYQVWYKRMVQRFRRYWADTIGHTDRTTDGQTSGRTDGQNTVGGGGDNNNDNSNDNNNNNNENVFSSEPLAKSVEQYRLNT